MGLSSERQESVECLQLIRIFSLGTSSKVTKGDLEASSLRMKEEKIILSQGGPLMELLESRVVNLFLGSLVKRTDVVCLALYMEPRVAQVPHVLPKQIL